MYNRISTFKQDQY